MLASIIKYKGKTKQNGQISDRQISGRQISGRQDAGRQHPGQIKVKRKQTKRAEYRTLKKGPYNGFSLVELLIAISIAGILMVFATQHTAYFYSNLLKVQFAIAIEEELDALEHVISTHLEKAGYLQQTKVVQLALPSTSLASVAISQFGKEAANSCITFSYDQNSDGKVSTSPNEFFGFRLRDKAIEYRVAKRTCKQAYWQDATDSKDIQIDDFSVATSALTSWGASYTVTIKASSRIMSSVKATKVFIVEVANVRQK